MKIDQAQLDKVEVKLNKQNAFLAAIAAAFWAIPLILMWYFVHVYYPSFSAIMLLINGLLVGFVVRIHGKGLMGVFSLIAILVHTSIVLAAFSLNIVELNVEQWNIAGTMTQSGHQKSGFPSLYDSCYHALAIDNDCLFLTADKRHAAKTESFSHLQLLEDWKTD